MRSRRSLTCPLHSAAGLLVTAGLLAAPLRGQERVATAATAPGAGACQNVAEPRQIAIGRNTALTMAPAAYKIGDQTFNTNVYNESFVAPTLTLQPGSRLTLSVTNNMAATQQQEAKYVAATNQHFHGLVVSPSPDSADNVTRVSIPNSGPRNTRSYHFPVPRYHTQGMFWYHPHPHGSTGPQVAGGLSGALMVGNILTYFPGYQGSPERTLLVRDMSFNLNKSPVVLNINGSTCARLAVRPGTAQLWHIGNFGANTFLNLKIEGRRWTLLGMDGNPLVTPVTLDSLYLPPGTRAEVIVTGPALRDSARLYSDPVAPKPDAPRVYLGWVVGDANAPLPTPSPGPDTVNTAVRAAIQALREAPVVEKRTFTYSFPSDSTAAINGTVYHPNDPPVNVAVGQVQEWTIVNASKALHTFHIHQTDFLVTSVNGQRVSEQVLRDNVPVGVHPDGKGGWAGDTVTVRFVFPAISAGPLVFHCHVLQHEDEGMMQNVCVYPLDAKDRGGKTPQDWCGAQFPPVHAH